jgi:hypothetical protein
MNPNGRFEDGSDRRLFSDERTTVYSNQVGYPVYDRGQEEGGLVADTPQHAVEMVDDAFTGAILKPCSIFMRLLLFWSQSPASSHAGRTSLELSLNA